MSILLALQGAPPAVEGIEWLYQFIEDEEQEQLEEFLASTFVFAEIAVVADDVIYSFLEEDDEAANDEIWISIEYPSEAVEPEPILTGGGGKRRIYTTYAPKRELTRKEEEELKRLLLEAVKKEEQERLDNLRRELHEASKSKVLRSKSLELQRQYEDYSELKETFSEIETLISKNEFSRAENLLESLRLNIYNARIIALLLAA